MELRQYQKEAISKIITHFHNGIRSVLYQLPTGGGKTVVFSSIIQQAVDQNQRVCVLVHRVELLNQAQKTLYGLGISSGRIKGKDRYDQRYLVHVASVQTLSKNKGAYAPDLFDLLVIDEAHHAVAGSWDRVIKRFCTAKVLGVTATPCRLDGKGLGNAFQVLIQGPEIVSLQNDGFLAPAKVYAPPPSVDLQRLKSRMGDFQLEDASSQLSAVHVIGDVISHYQKHLKGGTAIAFCCSVAHAESVAAAFNQSGISAASIDGSMSEDKRASLLEQLSIGSLKVLTSCALIGEGVDVPSVGGCILLRPTKSLALHLQMIGRCLRPDGGRPAVILDHVGNYLRLGHHLQKRCWSLSDGVSFAKPKNGEHPISSWLCQACDFLAPKDAEACPECGSLRPVFQTQIVTIDEDLVAIGKQDGPQPERDPKIQKELAKWLSRPLGEGDCVLVNFPDDYFANKPFRHDPKVTNLDRIGIVKAAYPGTDKVSVRLQSHGHYTMREYVPAKWVEKDAERYVDHLIELKQHRIAYDLHRKFEKATGEAKTVEELADVARKFGKSNPVGWAKTIMWHRKRQEAQRERRAA